MEQITVGAAYREYLLTLPLASLRVLGREHGVPQSTAVNKETLVEGIVAVLTGDKMPAPRSNKGAPAKQVYLDPAILRALEEIRVRYLQPEENYFEVNDSEPVFDSPVYAGILEVLPSGYAFIRVKNCQPTSGGDVFVSAPYLHEHRLRHGDFVACTALQQSKNGSPAISEVLSINNIPAENVKMRRKFDELTACYANKQIRLSKNSDVLSLRVLDLFVPIGKGQRTLIVAPPKAGKTTLLKDIARAVSENHRDICLIVLLIDERPEEVTDFRMSVDAADVIYSTFDESAEHHIRAAELTLAHAKRLVEMGNDVMILLDSITKLTRAYNSAAETTGKTLSGGLDVNALTEPKRFFGAARNTSEGGSLTVIATALVETGSRMDDVIFEEFKGTGNADIYLSRELAEKRVFPAVDLVHSGTRKEELLLSDEELKATVALRREGHVNHPEAVFAQMKKTTENAEFVAKVNAKISKK